MIAGQRLLLDTHALLWFLDGDERLPTGARRVAADPERDVFVSVVSIWETAIKVGVGKLRAPEDLPAAIEEESFTLLPIEPEHAWRVRGLPPHHGDPFDRLLAAQALEEDLPLVSGDARFDAYGVRRWWG